MAKQKKTAPKVNPPDQVKELKERLEAVTDDKNFWLNESLRLNKRAEEMHVEFAEALHLHDVEKELQFARAENKWLSDLVEAFVLDAEKFRLLKESKSVC